MANYIGNIEIDKVYIGEVLVSNGYAGSEKIYTTGTTFYTDASFFTDGVTFSLYNNSQIREIITDVNLDTTKTIGLRLNKYDEYRITNTTFNQETTFVYNDENSINLDDLFRNVPKGGDDDTEVELPAEVIDALSNAGYNGPYTKSYLGSITDIGTMFNCNSAKDLSCLKYFTGVTSIGDEAFQFCSATRIIIPKSVTKIEVSNYSKGIFKDSNIKEVIFANGDPNRTLSIGGDCPLQGDSTQKRVYVFPNCNFEPTEVDGKIGPFAYMDDCVISLTAPASKFNLANSDFGGNKGYNGLYVPLGEEEAYKAAFNTQGYTEQENYIVGFDFEFDEDGVCTNFPTIMENVTFSSNESKVSVGDNIAIDQNGNTVFETTYEGAFAVRLERDSDSYVIKNYGEMSGNFWFDGSQTEYVIDDLLSDPPASVELLFNGSKFEDGDGVRVIDPEGNDSVFFPEYGGGWYGFITGETYTFTSDRYEGFEVTKDFTNDDNGTTLYFDELFADAPEPEPEEPPTRGELPSEYTQVEKIISNAGSALQVAYKFNKNTSVEFEFDKLKHYDQGWLLRGDNWIESHWKTQGALRIANGSDAYDTAYSSPLANVPLGTKINLQVYVNENDISFGDYFTWTPSSKTFKTSYLNIFSYDGSDFYGFRGSIYSFKVYENGVPFREYIPVANADGVAGLYDLYTGDFVSSVNGNAFEAGSPINDGGNEDASSTRLYDADGNLLASFHIEGELNGQSLIDAGIEDKLANGELDTESINKVVVGDVVTTYGDGGDNPFAMEGITPAEVVIPTSVTQINDWAFADTPDTITYIGTMDEWEGISKSESWAEGIVPAEIQCTDGSVSLKPSSGSMGD